MAQKFNNSSMEMYLFFINPYLINVVHHRSLYEEVTVCENEYETNTEIVNKNAINVLRKMFY